MNYSYSNRVLPGGSGPSRGQWMVYRCWLGSLGISSIALGRSSDPVGTIGSSYSYTVSIFFPCRLCFFPYIYFYILSSSVSLS